MQRLTALDTAFLLAERPPVTMNIGALLIFEHLDATPEEVTEHIESRLHRMPRFRKKLASAPLGIGRPVWVDDEHFDIGFHVLHVGLGGAGDEAALLDLFGRLISIPLDRSRPLWELWMIDLPDGRHAVVQKVHHSMVDGVSDVEILVALLDLTPEWQAEPAPEWKPAPPPSSVELLRGAATEAVRRPAEALGGLLGAARRPGELATSAVSTARAAAATLGAATHLSPDVSLGRSIGSRRRFEVVRTNLDEMKAAKDRHGVTVNDVALAIVSCGLGDLLRSRGESTEGLELPATVPMSFRPDSAEGAMGNKFAPLIVELPVHDPDPLSVLTHIHEQMERLKASKALPGSDTLMGSADLLPTALIALGVRTVLGHQRLMTTMITNVPGPQFPLYFRGAEMLEVFPYVPLLEHTTVGIAIASYNGKLSFGISADWDSTSDLGILAEGIEKALAAL